MKDAVHLFGPGIDTEAAAIASLADELQREWTDAADLRVNTKGWIYDLHPYLFKNAFPEVSRERLQRLALAGRFLANAVVLLDMQIDEPVDDATAAGWALRATALQFEAYRLLHELFPRSSGFWPAFRSSISDFVAAYALEQDFASAKRPWRTFSTTVAVSIATGKTAMARGSVYGLAGLSDSSGPVAALVHSIDQYNIARQIFDDVHDWKADLRDRRPSIVLRELLPEDLPDGHEASRSEVIEELARRLYYEDVVDTMMDRVLHHATQAREAVDGLPELPWIRVIALLERGARDLQNDTRRITAENRERLRRAPAVAVTFPAPATRWHGLLYLGVDFLLDQWRSGFGEARAIGYFSRDAGFESEEYQSGDVFQRALISDALLDIAPLLAGQLNAVIDAEVEHLLLRRSADGLGWSFYPRLRELPNDADDLAQVMQVLLRTGRRQDVSRFCEAAITEILRGVRPDGAFETWIVPAPADREPVHHRQVAFIERAWGRGADPDVVANLLYALCLYDYARFRAVIARAARWLCQSQDASGSWSSTWYDGPFYGTYVNARLFAHVGERAPLDAAISFLRSRQGPDGGWSTDGRTSDALSTSLAALALRHAGVSAADPSIEKAGDFLEASRASDGGWPSERFIKMDMKRASGGGPQLIYYGSRTLTTALVCKAAAAVIGQIVSGGTLVGER